MSKEVSVHVQYGKENQIFQCKVSEFLSRVSERFKIKENEIEIYKRNSSQRIDVRDFTSVMTVDVKRKISSVYNLSNGPSTSTQIPKKEPNRDAMIKKLKENTVLTALERSYLIDLISNVGSQNFTKSTKNAKVQVKTPFMTVECQTDEIYTQPPSKRNLEANDIMVQSKRLAAKEKFDPAKAKELMDKLYNERRNFILLSTPLASLVKEKYPLLFSLTEVRNEIDRILLQGKCEQFLKNIRKYASPILSMVREDDPLLLTIERKIKSFPTKPQQRYAQQVGSVLMISSLMNEERGYLNLTDQPIEKSLFPYVDPQAKFNEIFFDEHLYKVYVEGHLLCEASDFLEAILCLIGTYYIFDIKYQDELTNTLIVFEQLYLERKDSEDLDECVEQIIQTIRLKAAAAASGSSKS